MILFNAILRDNGVPVETTWLARHQDKRMKFDWMPYKLWRYRPTEFFDYQSIQSPKKRRSKFQSSNALGRASAQERSFGSKAFGNES